MHEDPKYISFFTLYFIDELNKLFCIRLFRRNKDAGFEIHLCRLPALPAATITISGFSFAKRLSTLDEFVKSS